MRPFRADAGGSAAGSTILGDVNVEAGAEVAGVADGPLVPPTIHSQPEASVFSALCAGRFTEGRVVGLGE